MTTTLQHQRIYTCQKCHPTVCAYCVCMCAFSRPIISMNQTFDSQPDFQNIKNENLYDFILCMDEFCYSFVFFHLSNHELRSELHSSFMLFISNFHSTSWIYYNLFSTIQRWLCSGALKERVEGSSQRKRKREGEASQST